MHSIRPSAFMVVLAVLAGMGLSTHALAAERTYSPASTALKVDGVGTSGVKTSIVDTQTATGTSADTTLEFQPHRVSAELRAWLSASLAGQASNKDVELIRYDLSYRVTSSETIDKPFIKEVRLPVLDAQSADQPAWIVRLSTAPSRQTTPQGTVSLATSTAAPWTGANFRVEVTGLDMSRVIRVEPITVGVTMLTSGSRPRGPFTRSTTPTSTSTISTMIVTVPLGSTTHTGVQSWLAGDRAPRTGAFVYLSPTLKDALCTVRLEQIVPTRITSDTTTQRARMELTVGGVKLACP